MKAKKYNPIFHIKSDKAIGFGFTGALVFIALVLKIWLIWQALVVFFGVLFIYWVVVFKIAKDVLFFEDYILVIDLFNREKKYLYSQIQYGETLELSYKDYGTRYKLFLKDGSVINCVVRDDRTSGNLMLLLNSKSIKVNKVISPFNS